MAELVKLTEGGETKEVTREQLEERKKELQADKNKTIVEKSTGDFHVLERLNG